MSSAQRYQPWRFADSNLVRQRQADAFKAAAQATPDTPLVDPSTTFGGQTAQSLDQKAAQPSDSGGGGGGLWGAFKSVAGDIKDTASDVVHARNPLGDIESLGGSALNTVGQAFDVAGKYVGRPAFAIATGATSATRKPILDANGQPTGQFYRDRPSLADMFSSLESAVRHPVREYQKGDQAEQERFANPAVQKDVVGGALLHTFSNPLALAGGPAGAAINVGLDVAMQELNKHADSVPLYRDLPPEAQQALQMIAPIIGMKFGAEAWDKLKAGGKSLTGQGVLAGELGGVDSTGSFDKLGREIRPHQQQQSIADFENPNTPQPQSTAVTDRIIESRAPTPPFEVSGAGGAGRAAEPPPTDLPTLTDYREGLPKADLFNARPAVSSIKDLLGEKNRTDNIISNYANGVAEHLYSGLHRAGLNIEEDGQGQARLVDFAGKPTFEDMLGGKTPAGVAARSQLTAEQANAIAEIQKYNAKLNGNLVTHGGETRLRVNAADLVPELADMPEIGDQYFPRVVTAFNGADKTFVGAGSRLGAAQGFQRERAFGSQEEGVGQGYTYAQPAEALATATRAKLRVAQGDYIARLAQPFGTTAADIAKSGEKPGFGWAQVPSDVAPALKDTWFPTDVAKQLTDGLRAPSDSNAIVRKMTAFNRRMGPYRAAYDLSSTFQQGGARWLTDPAGAARTTAISLKSVFGNDDAYYHAMATRAADGPGLDALSTWGLHVTSGGDAGEFQVLGAKGAGAPVVGKAVQAINTVGDKSNQQFARKLNMDRVDAGNARYKMAVDQGLSGQALNDYMEQAATGINRMYGWTGTKVSTAENMAFFAPKYFRANIEQIKAALQGAATGVKGIATGDGLSQVPIDQKIAFVHLRNLAAEGTAAVVAINSMRGYTTQLNPTKSDFLRILNVAGQDISPFGPFATIIRAVSQVAGDPKSAIQLNAVDNPLLRFLRAKASPSVGGATDLLSGANYIGQPINLAEDPLGFLKTEGKTMLPFTAQGLIDEGPAGAAVSSLGFQAHPTPATSQLAWTRDSVAGKLFSGAKYGDLSGADKSVVNEDPSVAGWQKDVNDNVLSRADGSAALLQFQQTKSAQLKNLSAELQSGQISGNDWRDQYHTFQDELRGARAMVISQDSKLSPWFNLYDQATQPDGTLNYDQLDQLQAAYEAKHPGTQSEVDKITGVHDDATLREYRQATKIANVYYSIPQYIGLSAQEGALASQVLSSAQAMVSYGQAPSLKVALALLSDRAPKIVELAMVAQKLGPNPDRKAFRLANPLLEKYYSAATG